MLLWQLLFTLLYCLICNLFQTVSSNTTNNIDEVCFQLAIQYGNQNIILQKQSSPLYNDPVWTIPNNNNLNNNILVSYDEWTKSWEIMLPTTSNIPNIYRVESVTSIPPSTIYTHKFTQEKIYITTTCQSNTDSTDPSELSYPKTAHSCAELLPFFNYTIPDGIYSILLHNKLYQVYCAFDIENEFAWTLVTSFSQYYASTLYSLSFNLGINPQNPYEKTTVYRLPIKQMQSLQLVSTYNLITCNFDLSQTNDYLLLDTVETGWNILTKSRTICRPITELNIRGYQCNNGMAPFWTLSNHFHIDSSYDKCDCDGNPWLNNAIKNEDDFGQFRYRNRHHACSANNMSTTNYWIGEKVEFPTTFKSTCPEDIEGCNELNLCTTCDPSCEYCQNLNSTTCGPLNCMTCSDLNNNSIEDDYELWIIQDDGTGVCYNNNTYKPTCPPDNPLCTPMNSCEQCDDTCEYCQHPFKQICTASDCITCTDNSYQLISHHKYTYFPLGPYYSNTGYCHHNSTFKSTCPADIEGCLPDNQCTECHNSCEYCQSNAWGWLKFDVIMTCNAHECIQCKDPNAKFIQLKEDGTGYCMNYTQPEVTGTSQPCPTCPTCPTLPAITTTDAATTTVAATTTFDCSMCTITTEPCPELNITTSEPCDCTGISTTDGGILTTSKEPCNTETKIVYVNVSCPDVTPQPCPTLTINTVDPTSMMPTTSPVNIIREDCQYCTEECGMIMPPEPTATPTVMYIEPKVTTNYSIRIELRVSYETVDDLCPTDESFGDYFLELSTCQILDLENIYCEIVSITTIQTVPIGSNTNTNPPIINRRLIDEIDEFVIFIAMDISAETNDSLNVIEQQLNDETFAYSVNAKWESNSGNAARTITNVWTEDDIITPSPTTNNIITQTPTTSPVQQDLTKIPITLNEAVNEGALDKPAAIGMVIGIGIVLVICICLCFKVRDKRIRNKSVEQDNTNEGMTDAETAEDYNDNDIENSAVSKLSVPSNENRNAHNNDFIRVDNGDEKEIEIVNHVDGIGGGNSLLLNDINNDNNILPSIENESDNESLKNVLALNGLSNDNTGFGAAYFEEQALPIRTANGHGHGHEHAHTPQFTHQYENRNITHTFMKQSSPVITQAQEKKYKELLKQEQFLSTLEKQLNEISTHETINKEPGANGNNHNIPQNIDTLNTELIKLNSGIKNILDNLGYEVPESMFDDYSDKTEYCDIDISIEYSRFLNSILSKYGDIISNIKLNQYVDNSDELSIRELEEKRRKNLNLTKRSSKKQTNDNDIMNDYVMKPMKRNSTSYQNQQAQILQTMPSSPSFSQQSVSNLSNIATPIMQPDIHNSNKKRGSTDYTNDNNNNEITHKRDGYVNESTKRMDMYGNLPTPSKSGQYEDSDLKQNVDMEIINEQRQGLPQPINYDDNYNTRNRNESNVSGTTSDSGVGSLNSADSSDLGDISPLKRINDNKKNKPNVDIDYNANEAFEASTTQTSTNVNNNSGNGSGTGGSGSSSGVSGGSGSSGSSSSGSGNNSSNDNDIKPSKKKKPKKKKRKKKLKEQVVKNQNMTQVF